MTTTSKRKARAAQPADLNGAGPSKLDQLTKMLTKAGGATLDEMMKLTGWQAHSVRGAMAGTLKKQGYVIGSVKEDGIRRYSIGATR
jgi:hypothetical protein